MREIGPIDGFEAGLSQESMSVELKGLGCVRECVELEGHIRCGQSHVLIVEMAAATNHWCRHEHLKLAAVKMGQAFVMERESESGALFVNELAKEGVEEFGSGEAAIIPLGDQAWMTYVSEARVTGHEFIVHAFGARVDDLDVRQINQEQVVDGLVSLPGNKFFDYLSTRRCLAMGE